MQRTGKRIVVAAVVLAVVGLVTVALRPSAVLVETTPATKGTMTVTVDEEGETRVRDRYVVMAPVAGRVERLALREGDAVSRGNLVARIVPAPFDARAREEANARVAGAEDARRAADAALAQSRAAYEQAQRTVARARRLAQGNIIAPEEREKAELEETSRRRDVESADFRAQTAAHQVEIAKAALAGGKGYALAVSAPVGGRVLRIPERSERVVPAGAVLLEIGDPKSLEVVADLLSTDAVRVHPGDPIQIVGWGGDSVLHGRLRTIEPSGFTKVSALGIEEQRVEVVGDILDGVGSLGDHYRVEVRIAIWEGKDVLRIPASALFREGDRWAVFVVTDGRARRRRVDTGHRTAFEVEVVEGLTAGDVVIRNPSDRVTEGVRVQSTTAPKSD